MPGRIVKHEQVQKDLANLAEYIRQDNPRAALKFLQAAEKAFELLAAMPGLGGKDIEIPELPELRCWTIRGFEKHVIFYFAKDDGIEVIRVLQGSRDLPFILRSSFTTGD